jgi:hypothetical protein
MRWLTLTLLVLGLASPAWADTGWFRGTTNSTQVATKALPGGTYYWLSNSTTTIPHTPDADDTLDVTECSGVTTEWCLLPSTNDQSAVLATIFLYGSSNEAGTGVLTPYDADVDGGGVDHIGLTGDCGDDGDDSGSSVNASKWYGWSPSKPYLLVKQTVVLDSGDFIIFSLTCHD